MTLSEIYSQIAEQSGIQNVYSFSNIIPFVFKSAFMETLRIPRSEDSRIPYFETEILPLIVQETRVISAKKRVVELLLEDLDNVSINIYNVISNDINFKYVSLNTLLDISRNTLLLPDDSEGFWSSTTGKITLLHNRNSEFSVDVVYVKTPVMEWQTDYNFLQAGYGIGFLNSIISNAVNKLRDTIKNRG